MGEWSNLTQREKAQIIKFAIKNGVSDINTIRDTFNVYADGGYTTTKGEERSARIMRILEDIAFGGYGTDLPKKMSVYKTNSGYETSDGAPQDTYLMSRKAQSKVFENRGYTRDTSGDYGLVKAAVGNHNYPIWQRTPDEESRENLVFSTNREVGNLIIPKDKGIVDPGNRPHAFYINGKTGEPFIKEWDLNNYGDDTNGKKGSTITNKEDIYEDKRLNVARKFANILDFFGSPTVVTSGYVKAEPNWFEGYDKYDYTRDLNTLLRKVKDNDGNPNAIYPKYTIDETVNSEKPILQLQELEVTTNPQYKEGGSIHIKHPGRLTALKERTGKTEAELWATGNAHTRKMITFARNSRKWKHSTGGPLYPFSFQKNPYWKTPIVRY